MHIIKKNIKSTITAAVALLVSTACSGGTKQEKVMDVKGKGREVAARMVKNRQKAFILRTAKK